MPNRSHPAAWSAGALALLLLAGSAQAQVHLVNMIPQANSAETFQQSEPSLAVDPSNPNLIFATTFNNPAGGGNAPIFRSTLGGGVGSWSVFQSLPSADWSVNFSPAGGTAYLTRLSGGITVDRSVGGAAFSTIAAGTFSGSADQPYNAVGRVNGQDRIYVGFNDLGHTPQTASIHYSLNGGTSWSGAAPFRLETGTPTGLSQDSPPVRSAFATTGRSYSAWIRPSALTGASPQDLIGSLIVRRDDANATPTYANLGPGGNGISPPALTNIRMPWLLTQCGIGTGSQAQRARSGLTIAVDPNNENRVAVAYPDAVNGTLHLHVDLSTDGGNTWSEPMAPIAGGAIPNLAFAANGAIGLLYQKWDGTTQSTHILQSADGLSSSTDVTISSWLGSSQSNPHPYLGDYYDLETVNNTFYGIFTGSNDPSQSVWAGPSVDVQFDRFFSGTLGQAGALLRATPNGAIVAASLDPFFFSVAAVPTPGGAALLLGAGLLAGRRRRC